MTAAPVVADVVGKDTGRRHELALLVLIIALGAALRFSWLGTQSLWLDELYTRWLVGQELGEMLDLIPITERTPFGYYLVEWGWVRLVGDSEAGLRSLSALCGTATIPAVYAAGVRLLNRRVGLVAALLAAVNPLLVWYSQEARAYALAILLTTVALWGFACALDGDHRGLVLSSVASAAALAIHYFAVVLTVPLWFALAWQVRPRTRAAVAAGLPVLVGLLHVPLALEQADAEGETFEGSLARRLAAVAKNFFVGFSFPRERAGTLIALALVALAAVSLVFGVARLRKRGLLAWGLGGSAIGMALILALLGVDYLTPRNVAVGLVPLLVGVAAGFSSNRVGFAGAMLLAALSVSIVVGVARDPVYGRTDWRGAGAALGPPSETRALVVTPAIKTWLPGDYIPGLEDLASKVRVQEIVVLALATEGGMGSGAVRPPAPRPGPAPPGFTVVTERALPTVSLVVYRAAAPQRVTVEMLDPLRLSAVPGRVFLQSSTVAR